MTEQQLNQQVAERICHAGQWNGQPFHSGEWVALLDGKVVTVGQDASSVLNALRLLNADPRCGMIFEVGPPVADVIR